ncbi:hypothetical protein BCR36DRAFT_579015 [Piromyces finnis]|uniref:Uncharacterized protein n=1 Tax=Piromyces finnis TaxID=1754191 RepID=A0A1Y1VNF2_9FUNG|nr:hypothetical protein BCR36DRAFT_579015 [Piromyces finnis]|eukprot:ORX60948.1 hypothetical protein BCR36DRAFT_579015 [Piromyces finnis]
MNDFQFLLTKTTSGGGLVLGFEIGVITIVLSSILILNFLLPLDRSLQGYSKKIISLSPPIYTHSNKNLVSNDYYIPSYSIIGAFCGALLASYFGKKFERHRNNFIILFKENNRF